MVELWFLQVLIYKLTTIFRPKNWAYWMSAVHFWQTLWECLKNISFKTDDVKMSIPWQLTLLKIVCLPVPYLRQADTSSCVCNGGGCETAGCATTHRCGATRVWRNWSTWYHLIIFKSPWDLASIAAGGLAPKNILCIEGCQNIGSQWVNKLFIFFFGWRELAF